MQRSLTPEAMTQLTLSILRRALAISAWLLCSLVANVAIAELSIWPDKIEATSLAAYHVEEPYEFSNRTLVENFVRLPPATGISTTGDGRMIFPDGAVLLKRFTRRRSTSELNPKDCIVGADRYRERGGKSARRRPSSCFLELRTLTHEGGAWTPRVYVWEDEGWQLSPAGAVIDPVGPGGASGPPYVVPSLGECAACHRSGAGGGLQPIGTRLDRVEQADHVRAFNFRGRALQPRYRQSSSPQDVATAARRYLDVNCGFCHRPDGLAASSGLDLTLASPDRESLGVCKRPVAYRSGSRDLVFDIVPGMPAESILIQRMSSLAPGIAMPEIGRNTLDRDGIAMVTAWIAQMEGDCDSRR